MESRLSHWCEGLLEASWLVAVLAVPLFFNIHSDRVFEPDKIALLRSIALIMIAAWLVRLIDTDGWRNRVALQWSNPEAVWHRPFVLPVLLLVAVYGVATLFSVTPITSWAGSYQRLQGTYTTLSYIVIGALMVATIRRPEQVRRVVNVMIVASIPVSLYGILQHFGHDPLPWGGNVQLRVAGHLGNAIFIAAYLIMVVPLTLARIVEAFKNILTDEKMAVSDVVRASIYIFCLAIQLITIYWSGSRGPLIGLGVGLFAFILILLVSLRETTGERSSYGWRDYLPALLLVLPAFIALLIGTGLAGSDPLLGFVIFIGTVALSILAVFVLIAIRRGQVWLWLSWILLAIFTAGWLLLFNIPVSESSAARQVPIISGVVRGLEEWRELPVVGSYGKMLDPTNTTGREKSGRVRVLIWQGAINLLKPHDPLNYPDGRTDPFNWLRLFIGYGPESMYVAYNAFYPPELATVEARNASPDRSHNETFDALIITGLAGFIAWQLLYLSVIHFAFRYLGVIRSQRDGWVFAAFWVFGALLAALIALFLIDPIYLGVAIPTGVVLGIVAYLIYYALFSRQKPVSDTDNHPLFTNRLLMNALVAAVLAHYVEIHFGIAISATRLYFFICVALIFALGYRFSHASRATEQPVEKTTTLRRNRRKQSTASRSPAYPATTVEAIPSRWTELLVAALLMILMVGTLGYSFINYSLPPGKVITGPADLSTAEIVRQSLLQNAQQDYVDWPFIFSMIVLSWLLGWLVFLAEMAKHNQWAFNLSATSRLSDRRQQAAAGLFVLLALAGIGARFLISPTTPTGNFGLSLAAIVTIPLLVGAVLLFIRKPIGRPLGSVLGIGLVIIAFPIMFAGLGGKSTALMTGLIMAFSGGVALWLLWDKSWRDSLLPVAAGMVVSFAIGLFYTFLHTMRYRAILFYRPASDTGSVALTRALEAIQSASLLTGFYLFLFLILFLLAFALYWGGGTNRKIALTNLSPVLSFGALVTILLLALFLVARTNLLPIQADMIFKRGKPFDDLATRSAQTDLSARIDAWDAAIAIYTAAIQRAPSEDYYYLFQGRALLERAALTEDPQDKADLLNAAETLLLQAQAINPLNTDHTANLARLNTRWYAASTDPAEQSERLALAEQYYQTALVLSPQNSVIRNEYARLTLDLRQDCSRALEIYRESARIDPYYPQTPLALADAYIICGNDSSGIDQENNFRLAAATLEEALQLDPANIRAWVQLAEIYRLLGDFEAAREAADQARLLNNPVRFSPAEIDFLLARILAGAGETEEARRLAESARQSAEGEIANQIETFLAELETGDN